MVPSGRGQVGQKQAAPPVQHAPNTGIIACFGPSQLALADLPGLAQTNFRRIGILLEHYSVFQVSLFQADPTNSVLVYQRQVVGRTTE